MSAGSNFIKNMTFNEGIADELAKKAKRVADDARRIGNYKAADLAEIAQTSAGEASLSFREAIAVAVQGGKANACYLHGRSLTHHAEEVLQQADKLMRGLL